MSDNFQEMLKKVTQNESDNFFKTFGENLRQASKMMDQDTSAIDSFKQGSKEEDDAWNNVKQASDEMKQDKLKQAVEPMDQDTPSKTMNQDECPKPVLSGKSDTKTCDKPSGDGKKNLNELINMLNWMNTTENDLIETRSKLIESYNSAKVDAETKFLSLHEFFVFMNNRRQSQFESYLAKYKKFME
jgi:hypothetical protein